MFEKEGCFKEHGKDSKIKFLKNILYDYDFDNVDFIRWVACSILECQYAPVYDEKSIQRIYEEFEKNRNIVMNNNNQPVGFLRLLSRYCGYIVDVSNCVTDDGTKRFLYVYNIGSNKNPDETAMVLTTVSKNDSIGIKKIKYS